jgi:glycosyltransferase involved in cell wall biosynthesis
MMDTDTLDVIVRFHDVRRLRELDRAIFSIVTQTYRPIHVLLVLQRFSPEEVLATREALSQLLKIDPELRVTILNWEEKEPADGRSALLNHGIHHAQGRYLAFLDYDDVLYPEAYARLTERLRATQAAVAFGGIYVSEVDVFETFLHLKGKRFPFTGSNIIDLLTRNFCPIHSFVLDRSIISPQHLFFEPLMNKAEDYDFLIRICAQYPSDFGLVKTYIGTYYWKNDGSNSILTGESPRSPELSAWEDAESFLEGRRRTTPVSADVQRNLGLGPVPHLTVRDLLNQRRA